ncbi:MAG: LLM class flavin-dependent oxidoreductase [Chloroflexi bacterium]|nr:MAG: LLM class flavin-dependent oxidoreductase [Chloroflexota bacterium]PIE80493.1 MAG: LLM class flavin-dependent oxidoreductase [Chloroflexota bacterium]
MSKDRVALYLQDAHSLQEGIKLVKYAEEKGFEAVWQAESRLVRDAIVPMAAFAANTSKIKVASGVTNNWTRNIGLLAATFLTLDDLAQDRIICGIGAWWDPLASKVGINRRKPLSAMRETVQLLRPLLNLETVTHDGEFHHLDGVTLDVVHGRKEPRNVPIYIGATGKKMMELTGEIADGACLNYLVHPDYNLRAMDSLEKGAKKAGRSIDDIDRPQLMICSVDHDRKKGLDKARKMMVQYLGQQPHLMKASGVTQELLDEIHQVLSWPATDEEIEGAMHIVPDDVVQMCTASGSPAEVKAKVREYIDNGCTCPILYPLGDPWLMIDIFSEGYS